MPFICLPSAPSRVIVWGSRPWAVDTARCVSGILSVFCALCHREYQYLTQLISPFILMEFTLGAATLAEACVFSRRGRVVFLRRGWSWETECVKQNCCLAAPASALSHFPFLKVRKTAFLQRPPAPARRFIYFFKTKNCFAELLFPCMISRRYNSITLTSNPFRSN